MARPTRLTPEVADAILASLRAGAFTAVAAEAAGVGASTLREWMARGEGRDQRRPEDRRYAAFAAQVRGASAQARVAAECEVFKTNPLAWLRYGPGRERPGRPGWSNPPSKAEGGRKDNAPVTVYFITVEPPEAAAWKARTQVSSS